MTRNDHRNRVGAVVIGRNEGERLIRCLKSLTGCVKHIVYVDSGSSDGSPQAARVLGVTVVTLDGSMRFTAARARNSGFERSLQAEPKFEFIQFVDGDCEVVDGWVDRAAETLSARPDVAAVCGMRRERNPHMSIYNWICDVEWNGPTGEASYFGGDVMIRAEAFRQVSGYDTSLIAGEDPELSVRLRHYGWKILRLDADMTRHDAAMTRFGQWWTRSVRGGHAYAQGAAMHGWSADRHYVRPCVRIVFWSLIVPFSILGFAWPTKGLSMVLLLLYPLQVTRIAMRRRVAGDTKHFAWTYALFCQLAKWPQLIGMLIYVISLLSARPSQLIEYKDTSSTGAPET